MKKKRRNDSMGSGMPTPYTPDPKAMRRSAAEHMARTMMDTHPKMQSMRNHITRAVEQAAHRAMSEKTKRGRVGS